MLFLLGVTVVFYVDRFTLLFIDNGDFLLTEFGSPVFRGESPWLWPPYLRSHMHTDAADLGLKVMFNCLGSGS